MKSKIALLELSLIILAIIGLLFKIMHYPFAGIMLITSSCFLAILYFFRAGVLPLSISNPKERFVLSISFIACSIATIGLLFRIQHWPGSNMYLLLGGMALAVNLFVILLSKFNRVNTLRIIVYLVLLFLIYQFSLFPPRPTRPMNESDSTSISTSIDSTQHR